MDGERHRQIGAGTNRQMDVRVFGELRRPRIDHDQLGAAALRLADVRHQVNAGRGRIRAPDDDQARVRGNPGR